MTHINIEKQTMTNTYYRKVIHTTPNLQLVVMSLNPGEDIPREKHNEVSQFIRVEAGKGIALIGDRRYRLKDGSVVIIPPGEYHYIKNTSKTEPLKLYSIYAPPEHPHNRRDNRQPQ